MVCTVQTLDWKVISVTFLTFFPREIITITQCRLSLSFCKANLLSHGLNTYLWGNLYSLLFSSRKKSVYASLINHEVIMARTYHEQKKWHNEIYVAFCIRRRISNVEYIVKGFVDGRVRGKVIKWVFQACVYVRIFRITGEKDYVKMSGDIKVEITFDVFEVVKFWGHKFLFLVKILLKLKIKFYLNFYCMYIKALKNKSHTLPQ